MARESTREKVEREIAEGKLGIARDRLHGLIVTYPRDLSLRSRLGDVYWALGYPIQAGRFWFLDFPQDPPKAEAVAAYVVSCKGDPAEVLRLLKLRCAVEELGHDARTRVMEQVEECKARGLSAPTFPLPEGPAKSRYSHWPAIGCMAVGLIVLIFAIVGVVASVQWFRGWVDFMERSG